MPVAVLGAGAWGCALASLLVETGADVALWEIDGERARRLVQDRADGRGHAYLGVRLADAIAVTADLSAAVAGRRLLVVATPSEHVRATMTAVRDCLTRQQPPTTTAGPRAPREPGIVCAAKGLEAATLLTMDRVIAEALPDLPVVMVSGPTFAKEIAAGLPAAFVAASADAATLALVQQQLSGPRLRVYTSDDVVGVAVGGALKNVIAIAVGVADGLGFGDSARAALITRGLSEMARLAVRMGAHPLTLSGLAGLGDLVLTCTGDLSRNRQVGLALARGEPLGAVLRGLGQVAEGVGCAQAAVALAKRLGVEMPIVANVAAVLDEKKSPREAVAELLSRDHRAERD